MFDFKNMGITTAINGLLLALGPSFGMYYALDLPKYGVYIHAIRAFGSYLFAQIAKTIILAIIAIAIDAKEHQESQDAPIFTLNRLQLAYTTLLTLFVEFSVLAKLLSMKDYDNKQAK